MASAALVLAFYFRHLLREMQPILSTIPGFQVPLVSSPSEEALPVRVDSGKVEQVVMNLAVSAYDAMPTGGTLKIKTSKVAKKNLKPATVSA